MMQPLAKKAIVYCRHGSEVSKEKIAKNCNRNNESIWAIAYYRSAAVNPTHIEEQQKTVQAFAKAHNLSITKEFTDDGYSGKYQSLQRRKEFCEMLKYPADCLLVTNPVRICREENAGELEIVEKQIRDSGKQIIYTTGIT